MSNQLQVSGEAKIRAIQGPVVANSGVITALNGDASEYVRGDGTLADFPTSTGGGSSVSYYLNSSVSQGTIGGVAYRQFSKVPISGAGTDITISANGYIANYITDANDPSLLEVPAGNFNCEFYFSVNSNAHNPYVYAEVYKYDGTTFTLLGSNVSIPQYLSNGTTLSPYYFAIAVSTAVLTVTDRIAIRIYVNVDGRTVTLHTENNHLCQVVTTFSKGLISLNNLTRQNQFFATGTSGTDFAISSATATHTFNLPVASAANTGKLSSTDWSTFNSKVGGSGSDGRVAFWTGASTLSSDANLYYDYSTDRLGIGTNTPNASLGILNSSSTGIQVRTSDSANQYQANIFYDASYGMVYGYNRLGSGTASNLTFFNNIGGFLSIPESATNNLGFNTLNPQGLAGATVYDFTSLNTNVELRLHNSSTGYTSTDGSFIRVTSTALVIANAETSKSILINNGGNSVVTIDGTNKVAIGDIGVIPMTQQLTVVGSIEAYGGSIYQTVTSSMLKANASGQIIAAIAGTDYLAVGSAVTSVTATSPILSSGGATPNISIPAATTSVSGYLTSTDWTTFNNKFTLPSLTQGSILFSDGSTIAQNNNRLYWNNSTMRLGVGSQPVAQYVMYVKANVGENANAWLGIDNDNATGSTALRLILNGGTTSGFQYVQSTNMTQVYANAGDIQLINGSSLGLTIANTTGNATFSASVSATAITATGLITSTLSSGANIILNKGTGPSIAFNKTNSTAQSWSIATDPNFRIIDDTATIVPLQITLGTGAATFSSSATATSFVKTGGTSSQFLKADGSVDSTTYGSVTSVATSAPLTGGTITTSGTIGITQATTSANGYLSSTDWNTFNGKFTLPSLTSGSVLFSNGSTIAQDNANFYWDDVNNRLGIGTSAPNSILHILGASATLIIDGNSSGTQTNAFLRLRTGGFNVGNFAYNLATDNIQISNVSGGSGGGVQIYGTGGSTTGLTIAGAGGGTFASTLTVGTTAYITNDIFIGDTTSGSGRFFITDSSNQGITLRRTGATGDRFKMFVGNGTTYTQDNCIILGTNTDIDFYTGSTPTKRLTIGNTGLSTFRDTLEVYNSGGGPTIRVTNSYTGTGSGNGFHIGTDASLNAAFVQNENASIQFYTNNGTSTDERMRIFSTGIVAIGKSVDDGAVTAGCEFRPEGFGYFSRANGESLFINRKSSNGGQIQFRRDNSDVGNISSTTSVTSYNTTSDYRLKEDFKDFTGLDKICNIKIYDFKWKSDGTRMGGVIAHELQEILPYAVTGEKDALYEDGKPKMQSVDYSKIVPSLVKAIQEQQAQIEELKALINK